MISEFLAARWCVLVGRLNAPQEVADEWFQAIIEAYGEPHRAYHVLPHIEHLFRVLDVALVSDLAVEIAVWFHDLVYQPGSATNEQDSANSARAFMQKAGCSSQLIERVCAVIMATQTHDGQGDDLLLLFLDADMSILGSQDVDYDLYAGLVRKEFSHIPWPVYQHGRSGFLAAMLSRPVLFHTEFFRSRYEKQARLNLGRELKALSGAGV